MRHLTLAVLILLPHAAPAAELDWRELPPLPDPAGVAGPFVGVHNDALIVAGGANFPEPVWETEKAWHAAAWVLVRESADGETRHRWVCGFRLERPIAYGVSASTSRGVVCAGGNDAAQTYAGAFLLRWNPDSETLERDPLPSLPEPVAYAAAAAIGDTVYVAGGATGAELATATANFWSLDLAQPGSAGLAWRELPPWPGPPRAFAILAAQHNGEEDGLYLISGRREDGGQTEFLRDVYEYSPRRHQGRADTAWRRVADAPRCVMAGTGLALGQSHIVVLGGADGSLFHQADTLRDAHPGFPKEALAYHTITDTWSSAGAMPANHVTTTAVRWGGDPVNGPIIIPSGEIRPRVRSPRVWAVRPAQGGIPANSMDKTANEERELP